MASHLTPIKAKVLSVILTLHSLYTHSPTTSNPISYYPLPCSSCSGQPLTDQTTANSGTGHGLRTPQKYTSLASLSSMGARPLKLQHLPILLYFIQRGNLQKSFSNLFCECPLRFIEKNPKERVYCPNFCHPSRPPHSLLVYTDPPPASHSAYSSYASVCILSVFAGIRLSLDFGSAIVLQPSLQWVGENI